MKLTAQALDLHLITPFRIAHGVQHNAQNVLVQIHADGLVGQGEAAPSPYFGEKRESVLMALDDFGQVLGDDPSLIEDILDALDHTFGGHASAKASVDIALHDLMGQRLGAPLYRLLGLNPSHAATTSFTIAIDTPSEMARRAQEASQQYPILKIKLGSSDDIAVVRAIREVTDATLRVDANAAWSPKQAIRTIETLAQFDVELVEQPVSPSDLTGLRLVHQNSDIPIFADESCIGPDDIPRLVGCVDGINIKLMKCGGIARAVKMIHAARVCGLQVMIGCMIESSLAITASAHLTPLVDYADLDGALLVKNDPFEGVRIEQGRLILPDRPGVGVRPR